MKVCHVQSLQVNLLSFPISGWVPLLYVHFNNCPFGFFCRVYLKSYLNGIWFTFIFKNRVLQNMNRLSLTITVFYKNFLSEILVLNKIPTKALPVKKNAVPSLESH